MNKKLYIAVSLAFGVFLLDNTILESKTFAAEKDLRKSVPFEPKVEATENNMKETVSKMKVPTATSSKTERYSGYGKTRGYLGPITLGPTMSASISTYPIQLGVEGRYLDMFGFALTYGFFPELSFDSAKAKASAFDARLRWFPFNGAFFLGATLGFQNLTGTGSISGSSATSTIDVKTTFWTPTLGWRWAWESGFVMGLDFGWQMAVSSTSTFSTNASAIVQATSEYQNTKTDVEKVGKDLGNTALPSITLIHIGYMF